MRTYFTYSFIFLFSIALTGQAQSLIDGFSKEKNQFSVVVSYTRENYDGFYMGENKVDLSMTGLEEIITQSVNLYAEYGLSDRLDLIVNLPYISAKSDVIGEDETVSEENIQNGSVFLEWVASQNEGDLGTVSLIGAFGLSVPLSDYATNVIYAIGNKAASFDPKLVLQYKFNNGLFANVQGGV